MFSLIYLFVLTSQYFKYSDTHTQDMFAFANIFLHMYFCFLRSCHFSDVGFLF